MKENSNKQVVIGLSGGVDSAVAALLLKNEGFQLTGVFMKNWESEKNDPHCQAEQDLTDARSVCEILNIPFQWVNFSKNYWKAVFEKCLDEFAQGRTPNPDILCNQEIKFKCFLDYALNLGADFIATGHYAGIQQTEGYYQLIKAADRSKDQTYFLYRLNQRALSKTLFPLAHFQKSEVRKIAAQAGFPNYDKKDSTGICFIGERKFTDFLKEYLLEEPGPIKTLDGKVLGHHSGLMFYTLGQRKGLHIGGLKNAAEAPWYAVKKDIQSNTLYVAQGEKNSVLYEKSLVSDQAHWISGQTPLFPLHCQAKIRYRQEDQTCEVNQLCSSQLTINFTEAQRAITPGQSIVFYQDTICLGGGIIQTTPEIVC